MSRRRRRPAIENPTLAEVYEDLRSDFRAAKDSRFVSRLTGVSSTGSGMDYHYRSETQFLHMLERARFYQRNDPIVGQGVRRLVANIVQNGFRLDPNTGDESLDQDLKDRWKEWSEDSDACHSEGELSFHEMESLVLQTHIVDGDLLALPRRDGAVQFVEAHRLRTPRNTKRNVVHGVLLDENTAKRMQYWVTKEDLDPNRMLSRVSDITPIDARDADGFRQVFHVYSPYRFSQRRGITYLAPVSDTVGMHDDIQFAKLVQVQAASIIAILHERSAAYRPTGAKHQKGDQTTETDGGFTRTIEGVSAGIEVFGEPGETLKAFSPNLPNPEFFPHATLILTFIAINLDMPVHMLLLDPSRTNFSGWRGAIDQARLRFRQIQQWLACKFHRQVFRWKVRQWAATDPSIRSRLDAAMRHSWHPPTFAYIQPLEDVTADLVEIQNGLNSNRRVQARQGRDSSEVNREQVQDFKEKIRLAAIASRELNEEFPEANTNWRDLVALPTASGVKLNLPAPGQSQDQSNDNQDDQSQSLSAIKPNGTPRWN